MIPSEKECFELMKKYGMLDNIKAHSVMVERISFVIARGLREAGVEISLEKTKAGALLHDIAKTICLNSVKDHARLGADICVENHFEEIAGIVGEHVRLRNEESDGKIDEKMIVYYADKRVNHDKVVSIDVRMEDLFRRYGRNDPYRRQLIEKNFNFCRKVEEKLFDRLRFGPEELAEMI